MGISNYDKKSENMLNVFRLFVFWEFNITMKIYIA